MAMQSNIIGLNDVERTFGLQYKPNEIDALWRVPYSDQELATHSTTHVLVPGISVNLAMLHNRFPERFSRNNQYAAEPFAQEVYVLARWYLLRYPHGWAPDALTYDERMVTLEGMQQRLPHACEAAYAIIACAKVLSGDVCANSYIRTRDLTQDGRIVCVSGSRSAAINVFKGKALVRMAIAS
ncbi:MAG: hypothetical protein U0514_01675 [Candidatus Andersenbacteria bacterium]